MIEYDFNAESEILSHIKSEINRPKSSERRRSEGRRSERRRSSLLRHGKLSFRSGSILKIPLQKVIFWGRVNFRFRVRAFYSECFFGRAWLGEEKHFDFFLV